MTRINWKANEDSLQDIRERRLANPYENWEETWEYFCDKHFKVSENALKNQYYTVYGKRKPHEIERIPPLIINKFNWSFLNNFWNAGLVLTEHIQEDWHHLPEPRYKMDNLGRNSRSTGGSSGI